MGVNGLWSLLQPAAQTQRLEEMSGRKVAVDASLWLYHFAKAMKSSSGEEIPNSHILGFFRRICKLLYYGIKPVFVFDGDAPELKRRVLRARRERDKRQTESAEIVRKKLLTAQLKRLASSEVTGQPAPSSATKRRKNDNSDGFILPDMTSRFDHNPTDNWDSIDLGDVQMIDDENLEKISDNETLMMSFPVDVQQEILREIRIRSRQTSWSRLNEMIDPTKSALDFSRGQISNLVRRNDIWQRWDRMNTKRVEAAGHESRVASRNKAYMLQKNRDSATWSFQPPASILESDQQREETAESEEEVTLDELLSVPAPLAESVPNPGVFPVKYEESPNASESLIELSEITGNFEEFTSHMRKKTSGNLDFSEITARTPEKELVPEKSATLDADVDLEGGDSRISNDNDREYEYAPENDGYAEFMELITRNDAASISQTLQDEVDELRKSYQSIEKYSNPIDSDKIRDVQVLLSLFGVPFLNATSEAESECANLQMKKVVDDIITDDSDIFLFGGDRVHRHVFNQNRLIEVYTVDRIERTLGLTRNRLINIAHLLGSDYCVGVKGIGPVTAMEILATFPEDGAECLRQFSEWLQSSRTFPALAKYDKMKEKWHFDYSDEDAYRGYADPKVRSEIEDVSWGFPDVSGLRSFFAETLGWSSEKTDSTLLPVIKSLSNASSAPKQTKLDSFVSAVDPSIPLLRPSIRAAARQLKQHDERTSVSNVRFENPQTKGRRQRMMSAYDSSFRCQ